MYFLYLFITHVLHIFIYLFHMYYIGVTYFYFKFFDWKLRSPTEQLKE